MTYKHTPTYDTSHTLECAFIIKKKRNSNQTALVSREYISAPKRDFVLQQFPPQGLLERLLLSSIS